MSVYILPVVRWGFCCPSLTLGLILKEVVNLADGAVEGNNGESVISSVEDQVLSHDSQADEAEIAAGNTRILADIDAGKTCAKVSQKNTSQLLESSPEVKGTAMKGWRDIYFFVQDVGVLWDGMAGRIR